MILNFGEKMPAYLNVDERKKNVPESNIDFKYFHRSFDEKSMYSLSLTHIDIKWHKQCLILLFIRKSVENRMRKSDGRNVRVFGA